MNHSSPSVLVFDFFGVICSEIAPFWLTQRFSADEAARIKREVVGLADTGIITENEMFQKLSELAGSNPEQVREEWESFVRIDSDVLDLILSLKSVFRISLLTNAPSDFVRKILSDHDLERHFEVVVVSSEERIAKPDPEIYRILLTRLDTTAHDAIMIDDNPANVAGAIDADMAGIAFTSVPNLKMQIAGFNDVPPSDKPRDA